MGGDQGQAALNLNKDQTQRLTRILNMMGSHHDGEILNAARSAQKLLRSFGATLWQEVLDAPGARWTDSDLGAAIKKARNEGYADARKETYAEAYKEGHARGYKEGYDAAQADAKAETLLYPDADTCPAFARLCLARHKHLLTGWEVDFCEDWSVKSKYDEPSDKQIAIFQRLARKVNLTKSS
jgi:hypothetical protein